MNKQKCIELNVELPDRGVTLKMERCAEFLARMIEKFGREVFYGEEEVTEDKAPDEQAVFTLDCGELGLTASEAKATYAQIRKYVSEKFGAKVSSLYIAQVKRKYGLDLGKNYNVSKNVDGGAGETKGNRSQVE